MDIRQAERLVNAEMFHHGLIAAGWTFKWDGARGRFGQCRHDRKTISMSRILVVHRTDAEVRNTVLHEIAHALVGQGHGHDMVWRRTFIRMGGDGQRCGSGPSYDKIAKYKIMCAGGRELGYASRKTKRLVNGLCRCHHKPLVFLPNV